MRRAAWLMARYLLAVAAVAVFLFPLYWLVITALKPADSILTFPPLWWPRTIDSGTFAAVLQGSTATAIINSVIVATGSTVLAVGLGAISGYALFRTGRVSGLLAGWGLASRMVPPVMLVLPFLLALVAAGWTDSVAALTLIFAVLNLPYAAWMLRGYARDIPRVLLDAAEVAGLNGREIVTRVIWPMTRGGLIATAGFTFVLAWNELAFALVLTDKAAVTLPAQLARYENQPQLWATIAALSVIGMAPALVALVLMQRRLARSLSLGLIRD